MRAILLPSVPYDRTANTPPKQAVPRIAETSANLRQVSFGAEPLLDVRASALKPTAHFTTQLLAQALAPETAPVAAQRSRSGVAAYRETLLRHSRPAQRLLGAGVLA